MYISTGLYTTETTMSQPNQTSSLMQKLLELGVLITTESQEILGAVITPKNEEALMAMLPTRAALDRPMETSSGLEEYARAAASNLGHKKAVIRKDGTRIYTFEWIKELQILDTEHAKRRVCKLKLYKRRY
jgi:hypothetical protein